MVRKWLSKCQELGFANNVPENDLLDMIIVEDIQVSPVVFKTTLCCRSPTEARKEKKLYLGFISYELRILPWTHQYDMWCINVFFFVNLQTDYPSWLTSKYRGGNTASHGRHLPTQPLQGVMSSSLASPYLLSKLHWKGSFQPYWSWSFFVPKKFRPKRRCLENTHPLFKGLVGWLVFFVEFPTFFWGGVFSLS